MLENHFANGLSLERERGRGGFAGLSRIRGVFWDAAGPVYRCQWITPPCLCCLSNSRHRGNAKFPVALALAKARVHVHTDDCPTRGRDIEGEREGGRGIGAFSTTLPVSLSFSSLISDKDSIGFREWNFSNCKRRGSRRNTVLIGFHWLDRLFNRATINYSVAPPVGIPRKKSVWRRINSKRFGVRKNGMRNWGGGG